MDEENLLPGQNWATEITKAIESADFFVACLSTISVSKTGYVQKELKIALSVADKQPQENIFIVPVRLEECPIPIRFREIQYCNLYHKNGIQKLLGSLQLCIEQRKKLINSEFQRTKNLNFVKVLSKYFEGYVDEGLKDKLNLDDRTREKIIEIIKEAHQKEKRNPKMW